MEEDGFLEIVGTAPAQFGDGRRGGRNALLYRASASMLIRTDEWENLPRADREGHSFVVFMTLMSRISLSISAKAMDRDLDRHLSWKALEIDKRTWDELMVRLDEVLDWVIAAEKDAQRRMDASGEKPISATVALGGFRSPERAELAARAASLFDGSPDSHVAQDRLQHAAVTAGAPADTLSLPIRALILAETLERPLGASQFADEWKLDPVATSRHFRRMETLGLLEKTDKAPARTAEDGSRRGREAWQYCATGSMLFRTKEWSALTKAEREGHSMVVFLTLMSRISLSLDAKTMDRDLDRHLSWKALEVDKRTWGELLIRLDEVLDWVIAAEKDAQERSKASGKKLISATVALSGFRSPERAELLREVRSPIRSTS